MPAPQLHLTFGMMVKDQPGIIPRCGAPAPSSRCTCGSGPFFTTSRTTGTCGRGAALRPALAGLDEPWAYRMHSVRPERFVASYVQSAATTPGPTDARRAAGAGRRAHLALRARPDAASAGQLLRTPRHRRAWRPRVGAPPPDRKVSGALLPSRPPGHDPIGTAAFRQSDAGGQGRLVVARAASSRRSWSSCADAYRGAYGDAPDGATWAGWVRSFRHFGALVSMPIAKRNSDKKGRDPSLRPRYFENDVFRFWDFYACSERRVTELCNLAYAYFDARRLLERPRPTRSCARRASTTWRSRGCTTRSCWRRCRPCRGSRSLHARGSPRRRATQPWRQRAPPSRAAPQASRRARSPARARASRALAWSGQCESGGLTTQHVMASPTS